MCRIFKWFWQKFSTRFRSKHLGLLDFYVGVEIDQHQDGSISMCQSKYIRNIADKFLTDFSQGAGITRDVPHPANPREYKDLTGPKDNAERERMKAKGFINLMGSLLYVGNTRPDVSFNLSTLSRFMQDPSEASYSAAIAVLIYLLSTH